MVMYMFFVMWLAAAAPTLSSMEARREWRAGR